ncbi:hypothetical protein QN277_023262 [Acacia crassicarpa]|uniref:Membrane protein of ER body-like protein n=1 Tax=Acacia crassicarpa TaxID=499986 RepID=A0AAE1JLC7_9FABA|nr:hypothetical protein QN277_023262 [Acacia crassicarpa]
MEGLKEQWKEQEEAEVDEQGPENSETGEESSDVEKNKTLASFDPFVSGDSNSLNNVKNESERVGLITENVQLVREAYLESLYQKAPSEGFYCPNCKTCIQKILILDTVREEAIEEIQENTTIQEGEVQEAGSNKRLEILKCIVYGGLIEFITSLIIVISAASVDATPVSILAVSAANLLGGLLILDLHIKDMKSEQPRGNNQTNECEDRYYEVLGKRENYFLHACVVLLSYIILGLVPPLTYGFTFSMSNNNKDVTMAVVAGASALCITLLSIAKTYIQKPNNNTYFTYLQTVYYYLSIAFVGSMLSHFYGGLVKGFLEKHAWFGSQSSSFSLIVPDMSTNQKPRFGSY